MFGRHTSHCLTVRYHHPHSSQAAQAVFCIHFVLNLQTIFQRSTPMTRIGLFLSNYSWSSSLSSFHGDRFCMNLEYCKLDQFNWFSGDCYKNRCKAIFRQRDAWLHIGRGPSNLMIKSSNGKPVYHPNITFKNDSFLNWWRHWIYLAFSADINTPFVHWRASFIRWLTAKNCSRRFAISLIAWECLLICADYSQLIAISCQLIGEVLVSY